jgi:hypothetical protein
LSPHTIILFNNSTICFICKELFVQIINNCYFLEHNCVKKEQPKGRSKKMY